MIKFKLQNVDAKTAETLLIATFSKKKDNDRNIKKSSFFFNDHNVSKEIPQLLNNLKMSKRFNAEYEDSIQLTLSTGQQVVVLGLGEHDKYSHEHLRKIVATHITKIQKTNAIVQINIDDFNFSNDQTIIIPIVESIILAKYSFNKHKTKKKDFLLKEIIFKTNKKIDKNTRRKIERYISEATVSATEMNYAKDLTNEAPNVLTSEEYARVIDRDLNNLGQYKKNVQIKIFDRKMIQKEKMNLFLAVNRGSSYEPRMVQLTYIPDHFRTKKSGQKNNSKLKHIVLVGKGLTFDSGGYSLKSSMIGLKSDMCGSATTLAAFRAIAKMKLNVKVTCLLGITDNAISDRATTPDSIFMARNKMTVEILNTDAEGRLVLADLLDYACDLKPDAIIDCATLTGAVVSALGNEICGIMGNNQELINKLLDSAKKCNEYMWQLPIIEEFRADMKSDVADLKNMAGAAYGGAEKAAAFLEFFIKNDIPWAHLDIAGVSTNQKHLSYCPSRGGSGLIVRTLINYLKDQQL